MSGTRDRRCHIVYDLACAYPSTGGLGIPTSPEASDRFIARPDIYSVVACDIRPFVEEYHILQGLGATARVGDSPDALP